MRPTDNTLHLKKAAVDQLYIHRGNVSAVCSAIGISRTTFYEWKTNDPGFSQDVDDVKEYAIDEVENKMFDRIDSGDTTMIIFYLKTQGKKRGYVERIENTGADGGPIEIKEVFKIGNKTFEI